MFRPQNGEEEATRQAKYQDERPRWEEAEKHERSATGVPSQSEFTRSNEQRPESAPVSRLVSTSSENVVRKNQKKRRRREIGEMRGTASTLLPSKKQAGKRSADKSSRDRQRSRVLVALDLGRHLGEATTRTVKEPLTSTAGVRGVANEIRLGRRRHRVPAARSSKVQASKKSTGWKSIKTKIKI